MRKFAVVLLAMVFVLGMSSGVMAQLDSDTVEVSVVLNEWADVDITEGITLSDLTNSVIGDDGMATVSDTANVNYQANVGVDLSAAVTSDITGKDLSFDANLDNSSMQSAGSGSTNLKVEANYDFDSTTTNTPPTTYTGTVTVTVSAI